MKTTTIKQKLIARLHILAKQAGMSDDDYRAFLHESYNVTTSTHLTTEQLIDACESLGRNLSENVSVWRRRVMAVIGAYLRRLNYEESEEIIKAIACRSARVSEFNAISLSKLRGIYYEFRKQNDAAEQAALIKQEMEFNLIKKN